MLDEKYLEYAKLIEKWNKTYNLTAIRNMDDILKLHIEDSLTLLPFLGDVQSVLDVGTGAGLPGIPLAIARPDISFKLLDSKRKKINFLQHVVTSLQLVNALPICARVESLQADPMADMVVSRAFASLSDFVNLISPICNTETKIIAMKGRKDLVLQEEQQLPANFKLLNIEAVNVPGLDAERCLVFLAKQEDEHK